MREPAGVMGGATRGGGTAAAAGGSGATSRRSVSGGAADSSREQSQKNTDGVAWEDGTVPVVGTLLVLPSPRACRHNPPRWLSVRRVCRHNVAMLSRREHSACKADKKEYRNKR